MTTLKKLNESNDVFECNCWQKPDFPQIPRSIYKKKKYWAQFVNVTCNQNINCLCSIVWVASLCFTKAELNKSTVIWRGLYSYRQRYSSSQRSKCYVIMRRSQLGLEQIATTVMTNVVVDNISDHAKSLSICFLLQYGRKIKRLYQGVTRLVTHWREQR